MTKEYRNSFEVYELPYIEMYGGETLEWDIDITNHEGKQIDNDKLIGCDVVLTFTPFKTTSGIGNNAIQPPPSLKKTGFITEGSDGKLVVRFSFYENDTMSLRGKYIYQVDVRVQKDLRVSQGYVYIKQNNNRSAN